MQGGVGWGQRHATPSCNVRSHMARSASASHLQAGCVRVRRRRRCLRCYLPISCLGACLHGLGVGVRIPGVQLCLRSAHLAQEKVRAALVGGVLRFPVLPLQASLHTAQLTDVRVRVWQADLGHRAAWQSEDGTLDIAQRRAVAAHIASALQPIYIGPLCGSREVPRHFMMCMNGPHP